MKKRILSVLTAAAMIVTAAQGMVFPTAHAAESADIVIRLDPSDASPFNNGEFQGWGTSLCWWANRVGYSEKMTQQAADLFFSEDGLGLDIARYNLGGGDDPTHDHITRSDSKVPGYATGFDADGNIVYDWTADENQRNIVKAALAANADLYVEGFSNSPPYFMTNSGCSSGADPASSNNLKEEYYDDFAKFIAQTTKHFKDEFGITFKSYSPMNEPDTDCWGVNSPKQEGCHFDPGTTQSNMIIETRNALDAEGLTDVLVAGMDETSIDKSVSNYASLSAEAKTALGRIDTHTYSGSKRTQLKQTAIDAGKDLWMSEVDGATYFKNNVSDKENPSHISNGGHVEIYYKPSTGLVTVTVKNVTNSSALKTYTGSVSGGNNVGKVYFAGDYTQWNKTMVVDNLVTNIITDKTTE